MRPVLVLTSLLLASHTGASWFSSTDQPEYKSWNKEQLKGWLDEHHIDTPKGASQDQLNELVQSNWYAGQKWTEKEVEAAKGYYDNLKDRTLDTWSESQIRELLVKRGVVAPSGPREQLVLAANKHYRAYTSAASSLSAAASTLVYGDKAYHVTKSVSSLSTAATPAALRASSALSSIIAEKTAATYDKLNDTTDYIYSTWNDNELRSYLEKKGLIEPKNQAKRDELLGLMKEHYAAMSDPAWQAWSESYIFQWLHDRGLVRTDCEKKRDKLTKLMQDYYYGARDTAYSDWDESELKTWLVEHGIIKSNAQVQKEKLQKLVADNYATAHDTVYGGWRDSDMRQWLIDNGYLRSDAQVKRDELHKLMSDKYTNLRDTSAAYLTWPDTRLRAYIRANGVDDKYIPTTRPGLLQEVRIRWVEANNRVESLIQRIRDKVSSSVELAEAQLGAILESLTGTGEAAAHKAKQARADAAEKASEKANIASKSAKSLSSSASAESKSAKNEL